MFERDTIYDALIIGAGPAGAVSAMLLSKAGKKVLLVDKAQFPRDKVCGSCLSARTLSRLKSIGLDYLPAKLEAMPVESLHIRTASGAATLPLPVGRAISRRKLDTALIEAATAAGAVFMQQTSAVVKPQITDGLRHVALKTAGDGDSFMARTKSVVVADGIGGRALVQLEEQDKNYIPDVKAESHIGMSTVLEASELKGDPEVFYRPGTIYMAVNAFGYIGFVRMESGKLDAAAAFAPEFARASGSPQKAALALMATCGMPPIQALETASWQGTPPFSRKRKKLAENGLFIIGDAAAYSEPFTGEGIGWAIESAQNVAPVVLQSIARYTDHAFCQALAQSWQAQFKKNLAAKQKLSSQLGSLFRNEGLTNLIVGGLLSRLPVAARPLILSTSSKITDKDAALLQDLHSQQKIGGKY